MSGSGAPNDHERPDRQRNEMSGTSDNLVQAQRITGGVHFHGMRRSARPTLWIGLVLVVVVTVAAAFWTVQRIGTGESPLTVRVTEPSSCPGGEWVFPEGIDPADLPPPESFNGRKAYELGGISASGNRIVLTVHGRSTEGAVVLQDLRVRMLSREPATREGTLVRACTGAGSMFARGFSIDLDEPRPRPVPRSGDLVEPGDELGEGLDFPYRVSTTDPEVFWVTVNTETCLCRWQLELDWASPEGTGTNIIDLSGQPFRTTAKQGLRSYVHT
ncbi:hypothetical protein SAMN04487905_10976 [Actinopolyspora xinjiangensis]|uniref:Uncharacterized protein n=1 Tax=Actinopolyspora xinjiangensis TaxID=405564 RepID=A0A1H0VML7_9ACTN|nr:hypothetical protein [Actinopolyspora xinjiangensis]SDP79455.1 hypothetical protein SAMN04487905_10976 [Actinopolyspora xinjiangensis]